MKTAAIIIGIFLFAGLVAWIRAEILKAPLLDEPRDFMTPEEQEALENKARLQREMHERGRGIKNNLQATVRGTAETHNLVKRGATPRPATNFDAGDSVPNAGDANCEIQAGTGEPPVGGSLPPFKPGSAPVVNAPLSQSSLSARIVPFTPPYEGWLPFCLMCRSMQRMEKRAYGYQCMACQNKINFSLTHYVGGE